MDSLSLEEITHIQIRLTRVLNKGPRLQSQTQPKDFYVGQHCNLTVNDTAKTAFDRDIKDCNADAI